MISFATSLSGCPTAEPSRDSSQRLGEIRLGGEYRFRERHPAKWRPSGLGLHPVRRARREGVANVGMLVGGLVATWRNWDDDQVHEFGNVASRPRTEVVETRLFSRLTHRDLKRVVLTGVTVASDLKPRLLAFVPAQEHFAGWQVEHYRRAGQMQGEAAIVGIGRRLTQAADLIEVAGLVVAGGSVGLKPVRSGAFGHVPLPA